MPGFLDWTPGMIPTAAQLDEYVSLQVVMRFASEAARNTALASVLTDGLVTYQTDADRLTQYDGTGWVILAEPVQSWTPTASWTVGNGTWSAGYQRSAGWCQFRATFTFGSTSAIAGNPTLSLPVATASIPAGALHVSYEDATGSTYLGMSAAVLATGTQVQCVVVDTSGTYASVANMSGSVPFTWTTSDKLNFAGRFQMNTRYL